MSTMRSPTTPHIPTLNKSSYTCPLRNLPLASFDYKRRDKAHPIEKLAAVGLENVDVLGGHEEPHEADSEHLGDGQHGVLEHAQHRRPLGASLRRRGQHLRERPLHHGLTQT